MRENKLISLVRTRLNYFRKESPILYVWQGSKDASHNCFMKSQNKGERIYPKRRLIIMTQIFFPGNIKASKYFENILKSRFMTKCLSRTKMSINISVSTTNHRVSGIYTNVDTADCIRWYVLWLVNRWWNPRSCINHLLKKVARDYGLNSHGEVNDKTDNFELIFDMDLSIINAQ